MRPRKMSIDFIYIHPLANINLSNVALYNKNYTYYFFEIPSWVLK